MRPAALLYYHASRFKLPWSERGAERFRTSRQFDRLYSLDHDPFGVATSRYEQQKISDILDLIGPSALGTVLDVGSGTGHVARVLSERAATVVGVDFSQRAVREAQAKHADRQNLQFVAQNVAELSLDRTFDLFICSEVLYYLRPAELGRAIERMRTHANAGAALIACARADDTMLWSQLDGELSLVEDCERRSRTRPYRVARYDITRRLT